MYAAPTPACVILAGGTSTRMGRPKALLEAGDGRTFLERIVATYRQAGIHRIIVVLNGALLEGMAGRLARSPGLQVLPNLEPDLGKWHSLRLGMAAVRDADHCFLQHIDQPDVDPATLHALREAATPDGYAVPVQVGRAGHPVLLPNRIIRRLAALRTDTHLRELLRDHPRTEVPVDDPRCLNNINTPEEYAAYRATAVAP